MRSQTLFSYLLIGSLMTGCSPSPSSNALNTLEAKGIIGGKEVEGLESFANSVVAVYDGEEGQLCTGTLISKNVVLTAAHCLNQNVGRMYIFFGRDLETEGIYVQVDKAAISPYWNSTADTDTGDIALLHFPGKAPGSYKPIALLPTAMANLLENQGELTVSGYGVTDPASRETSKILHKTQVRISDIHFSDSEVLVDQTSGQGVCHGDSGGPAFVEVHGFYYLGGVTSRGVNDAGRTCKTRAAITSIPYHRAWIDRMSAKLSASLINFTWRGH